MKHFIFEEMKGWERFYRANFINSLTGFKSVSLVGTTNEKGQPNLAVFSSIVHIGSDPPLIGFVNRPVKAAPHTLANIRATGVYTINHIHPHFIPKAHQTSARYPLGTNEFAMVGLTEEYFENTPAPFVKESLVKYSLQLEQIIPIQLNDTFFVIGKVNSVILDDTILTEDGFLELDKSQSVCSNGIDSYYATQHLMRLPYAKP